MQNPSDLYRLDPEARPTRPEAEVLLVTLGSFIDAGAVQRILTEHLVETGDPSPVASFDADQLYDYRGRRPVMVFDTNRWAEYEEPSILVRRLIDRDGHFYYLLSGPEPDFQWERMAEAVSTLVDTLGVRRVVTTHGIPMAVPHTRPVGMTAHATDPDLIGRTQSPFGRVQVPGSFDALLELRLGERGHEAAGFAVHVPHYLAASEFAEGSLAALNAIVDLTGLNLPNDELVAKAESNRRAIAAEVEGNDEVQSVVAALEEQYDAFMRGQSSPNLFGTSEAPIPSAEELAEEFENFLRQVSDEDDPQ